MSRSPAGSRRHHRLGLSRAFASLAVTTIGLTAPASAQEWRASYFPYLVANRSDGLMLLARWQRAKNAPYFLERGDDRDVVNPVTFAGAFSIEAGIGTLGGWVGRTELRLPGWRDGWRFRAVAGAERQAKFGYYGFGGDLEEVPDSDDPNDSRYRVHRTRFLVQGDVTRRLVGPLRLALGLGLDQTRFTALDEPTRFADDFGARVSKTKLIIRPVLVLDTRDREFTPSNGGLIEVGAGLGTGADSTDGRANSTYTFGYVHARWYLSPREGTVIGARALAQKLSEASPLSARFSVFGWEREQLLSGAEGHRSFPPGAIAGTAVQLLGLEIRHDILNAGDFGAVTALAFLDYAHAEDPGAFLRRSTEQLGGGAGIALRVLRSGILTFNFATGHHGFNFSIGSGWTF